MYGAIIGDIVESKYEFRPINISAEVGMAKGEIRFCVQDNFYELPAPLDAVQPGYAF